MASRKRRSTLLTTLLVASVACGEDPAREARGEDSEPRSANSSTRVASIDTAAVYLAVLRDAQVFPRPSSPLLLDPRLFSEDTALTARRLSHPIINALLAAATIDGTCEPSRPLTDRPHCAAAPDGGRLVAFSPPHVGTHPDTVRVTVRLSYVSGRPGSPPYGLEMLYRLGRYRSGWVVLAAEQIAVT
jgi:hypothetical protein